MNLGIQPLSHYSDFDGTSESELSEVSIVLPYEPRIRRKKEPEIENPVKRQRGTRALRRIANETYLNTLAMITETDAERDTDNCWPDRVETDTGFRRLFEDTAVRAIWDAFISLSETDQIEVLGSLAPSRDGVYPKWAHSVNEDSSFVHVDQNSNNKRHKFTRQSTQSRRQRQKNPPVHLDVAPCELETFEEFQAFNSSCSLVPREIQNVPASLDSNESDTEYNSDTDYTSSIGSLSPRLRSFIKTSVNYLLTNTSHSSVLPPNCRKKRFFSVQDFCLIERVESQLKTGFSAVGKTKRMRWTPSTNILRPGLQTPEARGNPLVLNGFQRMLVHATATYLGLFSYSIWNESFGDRQIWIDNRNSTFVPLNLKFTWVIRKAMEDAKV